MRERPDVDLNLIQRQLNAITSYLKATVCQPFTSIELAERVANLTESMTGDQCEIVSRGPTWHLVLRRTPEGKMVRA